ncbi:Methyltransferase type 11 [[Leptolyngbya] sp. PCC 7376]|uniref:methyltransferase domain-containing protein n=1 Tax=[Leptolyngbya] sp. PCC 7376 TaxID=111781 RepID=UPI00029EE486|nr:methyltransferase domain-containing protein [[Leptolyngbya] sp. PCC 7376]AFY36534.1 Methyltransferase type 11 [[Leptolyngbya] sp. PCC 7376]
MKKITKKQYYSLLEEARNIYRNQGNITEFLRETLDLSENSPEIIEIAYDLQAGSYVQHIKKNPSQNHAYCEEIAKHIEPFLEEDSLLEVGCGEATTTFGVIQNLIKKPSKIIGFDISFSRIQVAKSFWEESLKLYPFDIPLNIFVADLFHIPLRDNSVDLVYTSHSIEPNGGKELEALKSIFRIAKKRVLLFEPYFEGATVQGQARMSSHGYIKNLPTCIEQAGGILQNIIKIENTGNPLNPTYLFDIEITDSQTVKDSLFWVDPVTLFPLEQRNNYFYCPKSGLAYPILTGIPCLRPENSILATGLSAD